MFLPFPGTTIFNSDGSRKKTSTEIPAIIYKENFLLNNKKNISVHRKSMVENEQDANLLFLEYKPIRRINK